VPGIVEELHRNVEHVRIFLLNHLNYVTLTDCSDFDIELCSIKIQSHSSYIYILAVYRAPTGKFTYFLHEMDKLLRSLYNSKIEFIICGDFNVDYLTDNCRKSQLNSLLNSYNLFSIVNFSTRIWNTSKSAIDNLFIDYSRLATFYITPIPNGISDHDAQLILIHDITLPFLPKGYWKTRKIDKCSLADFNYKLSFEIWKEVFEENDVNVIFNSFLNIL
jgi:hypothetical protein